LIGLRIFAGKSDKTLQCTADLAFRGRQHWTLLKINGLDRSIEYQDSLGGNDTRSFEIRRINSTDTRDVRRCIDSTSLRANSASWPDLVLVKPWHSGYPETIAEEPMRTYSTRALDVVSVSGAGYVNIFVPIRTVMYQGETLCSSVGVCES
jgi:hypothetical protein